MDHPHTLVMHVWSIIRPLCINGDHWLILTNGQISIWCDFCTWNLHVLGFPIFIGWKKLDKSVVSRQSCRGYRMLKGTRQWACCRLGSQNARWRAISTAHHPLYPGYGNGTWKLTLLMIGRAPDGKKLRLQSRASISWHKLPQRLQGYASHGSAPVRSAAGSTRSTWALAHLRLSHFWHHLGSKTVSTGPGYTKTGLRFNGEVSSSLTNRGFVCTPSTDVKECGDDLERGMPPAAYISTTDGEVRVWWCGQPSRSITSRPWWSSKGIWLRYVTSLKWRHHLPTG